MEGKKMTKHEIADLGYSFVKQLPSGEWAGIQRQLFTYALIVGIDKTGYRTRFCYSLKTDAVEALAKWDGKGFPPGYWIKQKPEDVLNPLND